MKMEAKIENYESVRNWLSRLRPSSAESYIFQLKRFYKWMRKNGVEIGKLSPDELVVLQSEASNSERFKVLDVLQRYVGENHSTLSYKKKMYQSIRSFFLHNRAELPQDRSFNIRGDKPKTVGTLTIDEVRLIILASKPVYQAAFMCMIQGGMGGDEVCYWSMNGWAKLEEDLKGDPDLVEVELPGRKAKRFENPYFTLIGGDAIEALRKWLPYRPENSPYIFTNQYDEAITPHALGIYWVRVGRRIGVIDPIKRGRGRGHQTGKNLHEIRDVFRSQWEKSPAKASVAEFMMGHVVDPLEYNKAHYDRKWVRKEYLSALPMFQLMSSGRPFGQVEEDLVDDLRDRVNELEAELEAAGRNKIEKDVDFRKLVETVKRIEPFVQGMIDEQKLLEEKREKDRLRESSVEP